MLNPSACAVVVVAIVVEIVVVVTLAVVTTLVLFPYQYYCYFSPTKKLVVLLKNV